MRIATPAVLGITVTLSSLSALAQPEPAAPAQPSRPAETTPAAAPLPPVSPPPEQLPPPPPPGAAAYALPPPPPPVQVFAATDDAASVKEQQPLAGWHGNFFLRDPNDSFRLYPKGRINLDFYSTFGPGVSDVTAVNGGSALKPRFFVRRARLEIAGEFLKRWSFNLDTEFGGQTLNNTNGRIETYAAKPGEHPTAETARFASVESVNATASLADIWVNYAAFPALNFIFGQYAAPFAMETQTSDNTTTFMERNISIRGFAYPEMRDIGLMLWGELADKMLVYRVGVFSGDGQNRPGIDTAPEFIGRIVVRPFGSVSKGALAKAHIGVSARHGEREQQYVGYDYAQIRTAQGYPLWSPTYNDSQGRQIHVIPSGMQNGIGGELRLPIGIFDVRAEAYYIANNTREAVEGFQLTTTERLGQLKGLGWYTQISAWPAGDPFISGDPGSGPRPTKVDLSKEVEKPKKGVEIAALIAGINATYDGASRQGDYDEKTPGAQGGPVTNINIMQLGFAASYWHTKNVRLSINYTLYMTPNSGSGDNLARVPGNTVEKPDTETQQMHELSTRLAVAF